MAQPVTDDELQLRKRARRRLVGAIVLVLLVVVFLPMALDNKPRPLSKNVDIQVPAIDSLDKKLPDSGSAAGSAVPAPPTASAVPERSAPLEPPPEPPPVAPVEAKPAMPAPEPEPAKPAPAPDTAKKPEPVARKPDPPRKPEPVPVKSPATKAGRPEAPRSVAPLEAQGYVVQLGAFTNAANAKQLYQKVRAARVPAYLETVRAPDGEKTRVRAGPFPDEAAADKARQKMLQSGLVKGALKIVKQGE